RARARRKERDDHDSGTTRPDGARHQPAQPGSPRAPRRADPRRDTPGDTASRCTTGTTDDFRRGGPADSHPADSHAASHSSETAHPGTAAEAAVLEPRGDGP